MTAIGPPAELIAANAMFGVTVGVESNAERYNREGLEVRIRRGAEAAEAPTFSLEARITTVATPRPRVFTIY